MKKNSSLSQKSLWLFMITVICGVIVAGIFTNLTLRSIEKKLPSTLLAELNDLSLVLEDISDVITAGNNAKNNPHPDNYKLLRSTVATVADDIVIMRESYVFDNLIQASAFHAVVAPAITDLKIWFSEGVSGFEPESPTTLAIALSRINVTYQKARALNRESRIRAHVILVGQQTRIDRFLVTANVMFILTVLITFSIVYLLFRQYSLQKRDSVVSAELREQRDLLNSFFENVPLGITVWDHTGLLLFINNGFTEITGYSMEDLHSLEDWFAKAYPNSIREKVLTDWKAMTVHGKAGHEFKVTCKNSDAKDIEFRNTFLKDGRSLVTMSDITDRKMSERILKENQKRKVRTSRMESLGLLAGGVAHDLNNILSGIVGYPELILADLPQNSKLRKPIEAIKDSGSRAATVVADLLTVARGVACAKVKCDLNLLTQKYLRSPEFLKLKSLHPGVFFKHQFEAKYITILASEVHVQKCLMNLATNAAEAVSDNGTVTISTCDQDIDETEGTELNVAAGRYVVVRIQDNGTGIAENDLEHIFEPFYTKKVMGKSGTGLGLTVVWNTMEEHDGKVVVDSDAQGTCFQLYFPIVPEDEKTPEFDSHNNKEVISSNGEHILVVDDEVHLRDISSQMLQSFGYKVDVASSGKEAVQFVKDTKIDLIILDMFMEPGINGRQTYEEILKLNPTQRAIVASGFSESEDVKATLLLGANGFIKKPYTMDSLGQAVKEALHS